MMRPVQRTLHSPPIGSLGEGEVSVPQNKSRFLSARVNSYCSKLTPRKYSPLSPLPSPSSASESGSGVGGKGLTLPSFTPRLLEAFFSVEAALLSGATASTRSRNGFVAAHGR